AAPQLGRDPGRETLSRCRSDRLTTQPPADRRSHRHSRSGIMRRTSQTCLKEVSMTADTHDANKALVARHFAILSGGDPAEWDEIMAEHFVTHHPLASGIGRDRYRDSAAAYRRVFADFVSEVQRMVAEDDY